MRKFLTAFGLMIGISALAATDVTSPEILQGENEYYLIPDFSENAKQSIYTENTPWDSPISTFNIYDDDIRLVKELKVERPVQTRKSYRQEEDVVALHFIEVEYRGDVISSIGDIDEALKYFKSMYGDSVTLVTLENGEQVIAISFFMEKEFGKKYPYELFSQFNDAEDPGVWRQGYAQYEFEMGYKPDGKVTEYEESSYARVTDFIIPEIGGYNGWSYISRGIFTDNYTYILPIFADVPFSIEHGGYKEWGTLSRVTGYQVYDIDSNPLLTISLPEGWYDSSDYSGDFSMNRLEYLNLNGKKYLVVSVEDTAFEEDAFVFYRLDTPTKVTQMAITPAGKISPRAPRKGDTVTVEIDERFSMEPAIVNVCSSDGRSLIQKTIKPGESRVTFNTGNLPQGIYVVNVTGKTDRIETAKIIVR